MVLLTGDLEAAGEQEILGYFSDISSHILKVSHNGSRTSSTLDFLNAVKPDVSIVMCGSENRYGHPHQETLTKLNSIGTTVLRTDKPFSLHIGSRFFHDPIITYINEFGNIEFMNNEMEVYVLTEKRVSPTCQATKE